MARRGLEPDAEALGVVDRGEDGGDLELTAVARSGVDVSELQRAPVASGRLLDLRRPWFDRRQGDRPSP